MTGSRRDPWEVRVYRAALRWLPGAVLRRHGRDMVALFRDRLEAGGPDRWARARLLAGAIADAVRHGRAAPRARAPRPSPRALDGTRQDVRFAVRTLRRRPLFAAAAVATLALGIGGTTAIYSVVDAVLVKRLPYRDPDAVVSVWRAWPSWRGVDVLDYVWDHIQFSMDGYLAVRRGARTMSRVEAAAYRYLGLTEGDRTEEVAVGFMTPGLLDLLGVRPVLGRAFAPEEGLPGADAGARVALLDHDAWLTRFAGDPEVLGRSLTLQDEPYRIVGVLPPRFRIVSDLMTINDNGGSADTGRRDVWVPMGRAEATCGNCLEVMARLAPGRTPQEARGEVQGLLDEGPDDQLARVERRGDYLARGLERPLLILLGAAALLMVVACLNVAGLLLGRVPERLGEVRLRAALGAGRGRLLRQLLTESLLLGLAGAAGGLVLARLATSGLLAVAPPMPRLEEVALSGRVLAFAVAAGLATGVLFGVAPAVTLLGRRRGGPSTGGRGAVPGTPARLLHGALVATQVGLAVWLLVAGGLFARSVSRLMAVDPGFDAERLAAIAFRIPPAVADDEEALGRVQDDALRAAARVPGVRATSATAELPFPGGAYSQRFAYERDGTRQQATLWNRAVVPGYLELLRVPLLEGRSLDAGDDDAAPRVVVVSRSLADRLWPGASPLGERLFQGDADDPWTVVGVVGDTRHKTLGAEPEPTFYRTTAQRPTRRLYLVARTSVDAGAVLPALREAIWRVDPGILLSEAGVVAASVRASEADDRFRAILVATFAALAAALAAVGVAGVTGRAVTARTRELGVRAALGASPDSLVGLVLRRGLGSALAGIALGLASAWVAAGTVRHLLFGVAPTDPATYATVAAITAAASALAAWLPARRAARVDPRTAIAHE